MLQNKTRIVSESIQKPWASRALKRALDPAAARDFAPRFASARTYFFFNIIIIIFFFGGDGGEKSWLRHWLLKCKFLQSKNN